MTKPTSPGPNMAAAFVVILWVGLVAGACGSDEGNDGQVARPDWVEAVYPEPGSTLAVPDAVEVDHDIQATDEDVRLVIDGVDVTTYATFEAGKIRYESGTGPVELGDREHTAEVQRVRLPFEGTDYEILDTFSWQFRSG